MRRWLRAGLARALPNGPEAVKSLEELFDPAARRVITCPHGVLSRDALEKLFSHECGAVRVPGFYPVDAAADMAERLRNSDQRRGWHVSDPVTDGLETSDVDSVGTPLTSVLNSANGQVAGTAMEIYLKRARELTDELRAPGLPKGEAGAGEAEERATPMPVLTPVDKLRLLLDDVWVEGARVARDKQSNEALLAGAGRIMLAKGLGHPGFCHVDDINVMHSMRGTFSANIYLAVPPEGGELLIYPIRVRSRMDFYKHAPSLSLLLTQEPWAQKALRACLPQPLRVQPVPGELVIICTQRPHAVSGFDFGDRVSMQGFIECRGAKKSLLLDS